MRLLITGGSGYLGARLTQLADRSGAWEAHPTYLANPLEHPRARRLDLRDGTATRALVAAVRPEAIIHQAVSPRSDEHIAAIVPAARNISEAARDVGARLIHVSTDMVFDGADAPYSDEADLTPVNPYAAAKAAAEDLLLRAGPADLLIVRPSLIYGFEPIDKQTQWLVDGIRKRETVRLFTDEIRCPLWVDTVALALLELAASSHTGRLNLGGPPLNRWEFGMKMLACLGIEPGPTVVPGTVAESANRRPRNLTLDCRRAAGWLATPLLTVEQAWAQFAVRRVGPQALAPVFGR